MPRPAKPALERIARTLCSRAGHPENIQFEGKPMWQSFLADAHAALVAIREPSPTKMEAAAKHEGKSVAGIYTAMIDAALLASPGQGAARREGEPARAAAVGGMRC